ncbi:MAG: hypothetical protein F6K47_38510 [Symploca sp. SIO2E6]|nr:hypothetical protein [Symploca sp. SIO2E6]
MPPSELIEALNQLELALGINAPIGATELPPELRYFRVIAEVRKRLCPQLTLITDLSKTSQGEIVTVLTDTLIALIGNFPVPIATLAKHLAAMGIEEFCKDQSKLLKQ